MAWPEGAIRDVFGALDFSRKWRDSCVQSWKESRRWSEDGGQHSMLRIEVKGSNIVSEVQMILIEQGPGLCQWAQEGIVGLLDKKQ